MVLKLGTRPKTEWSGCNLPITGPDWTDNILTVGGVPNSTNRFRTGPARTIPGLLKALLPPLPPLLCAVGRPAIAIVIVVVVVDNAVVVALCASAAAVAFAATVCECVRGMSSIFGHAAVVMALSTWRCVVSAKLNRPRAELSGSLFSMPAR